jgi:hypothetical protein
MTISFPGMRCKIHLSMPRARPDHEHRGIRIGGYGADPIAPRHSGCRLVEHENTGPADKRDGEFA